MVALLKSKHWLRDIGINSTAIARASPRGCARGRQKDNMAETFFTLSDGSPRAVYGDEEAQRRDRADAGRGGSGWRHCRAVSLTARVQSGSWSI